MKILVTGGLGYLGPHIVRFLAEELGRDVRILTNRIPDHFETWPSKYETVVSDTTDAGGLEGVCEGCQAVIHLAALGREEARLDPERALLVSGMGTKNILSEARKSGVERCLYFSTVHVYGSLDNKAVDETTPVNPLDDYSLCHFVGELYCQTLQQGHGLFSLRVRLSNGYGAPLHREVDCWSVVVQDFCRSAYEEGKIQLKSAGTQRRDFISIPEILRGVRVLLEAEPAKIRHDLYHLGSGVSYSIREIAEEVKNVYRKIYARDVEVTGPPSIPAAEAKALFRLDISRLQELGFRPGPADILRTQIAKTFELLESGC
jgi:UDP-glucose 4-epimerase